ncbi:MAG TPA: hypothetical protein VGC66_10035 [Pyrinomonadaceae bacterium]|jgi:hypothetical protein
MRCLYCGIKLKIAEKAFVIRHCPECSVRIECESSQEAILRAEDRNRSADASSGRRRAAFALMKIA